MAPHQTPVTAAFSRHGIIASIVKVTLKITAVVLAGADSAFACGVCQSLSLLGVTSRWSPLGSVWIAKQMKPVVY